MALPKFSREQILAEIARRERESQQKKGQTPPRNVRQVLPQNIQNTQQRPQKPPVSPQQMPPQQRSTESVRNIPESKYAIDEKTGKRYKKLDKQSQEAAMATTVSGLLSNMELDEDIRGYGNLNAAADIFLSHLRVPPDKEELARLREAKLAQIKKQNEEYAQLVKTESEKEAENTGW